MNDLESRCQLVMRYYQLGSYNPFPHVIAKNAIEHITDCPGCAYSKTFYEFVLRVLDRLEESPNER